jgi:hypothetical protein
MSELMFRLIISTADYGNIKSFLGPVLNLDDFTVPDMKEF